MPKTPSNKLFRLIKSLSGSEKRYFKLFVHNGKTGKENKYIQLFDAIEAQEVFDESMLKQSIYADAPIESRKYSELKSYLYDLILKSLQAFDEKTSVDFRLKNMLQGVRVLYKRMLFEDCKDLLQKAKKLAYRFEKFNAILEILEWEKQIAYAKSDIDYLNKNLPQIEEEEGLCQAKIAEILKLRNLFLEFLLALRMDALRKKQRRTALEKEVQDLQIEDADQLQSHRAKIWYYRVMSGYHYLTNNSQDFYLANKQLVTLLESAPALLNEDLTEYISVLSNLTMSSGKMGKYEEVELYLKKLKKLKPKTIDDELKIHRQYYTNKFRLCIMKGDFELGLQELENHFREVRKFDSRLFERSVFYFQYFYIYFGTGQYEKALDYLNQWLNQPKTVERQDLQSLARILNLILHYEMGNALLLESLLRSTYRFLNKRNRLHEFERKMVGFIREAIQLQSKKEVRKLMEELKREFKSLSLNGTEKAMLQLFDIEAWLDSKISHQSFAEVVRLKYEGKF